MQKLLKLHGKKTTKSSLCIRCKRKFQKNEDDILCDRCFSMEMPNTITSSSYRKFFT